MIRNQDHPLREITFQSPILGHLQLPSYTLISTNYHLDRRPPVRHGGDGQAKLLLRHGHPGVEVVLIVPV